MKVIALLGVICVLCFITLVTADFKDDVKDIIATRPVVMFSKSYCPYGHSNDIIIEITHVDIANAQNNCSKSWVLALIM